MMQMAYHHTETYHTPDIFRRVLSGARNVLSSIGKGIITIADANTRVKHVEKLQAKSDAELAALGLRREDIVRYVFKDMLHT